MELHGKWCLYMSIALFSHIYIYNIYIYIYNVHRNIYIYMFWFPVGHSHPVWWKSDCSEWVDSKPRYWWLWKGMGEFNKMLLTEDQGPDLKEKSHQSSKNAGRFRDPGFGRRKHRTKSIYKCDLRIMSTLSLPGKMKEYCPLRRFNIAMQNRIFKYLQ